METRSIQWHPHPPHPFAFLSPSFLSISSDVGVTASPPSGPFFSELQVVRAGLASHHGMAIAIFLVCLLLAFLGLTRVVFGIVDGRPRLAARANGKHFVETTGVIVPPLMLLGLSLWLGLFPPATLREAWLAAVAQLIPVP